MSHLASLKKLAAIADRAAFAIREFNGLEFKAGRVPTTHLDDLQKQLQLAVDEAFSLLHEDPTADVVAKRDLAKAKFAAAKATGDYSKLSEADVKAAGLPVIELPDSKLEIFPNTVHIVIVDAAGVTKVISPFARADDLLQQIDNAGIRTQQVLP